MKATILLVLIFAGIQQMLLSAQPMAQAMSERQMEDELRPVNAVFLEAGGSGLIGSINYERMVTKSVGVRVGYGAGIPLLVNYYIGEKYRFELGAGVTHVPRGASFLGLGPDGTTLMTMTLGHKFQPLESGVILRLSATPLYSLHKGKLLPSGGVSIGYAF